MLHSLCLENCSCSTSIYRRRLAAHDRVLACTWNAFCRLLLVTACLHALLSYIVRLVTLQSAGFILVGICDWRMYVCGMAYVGVWHGHHCARKEVLYQSFTERRSRHHQVGW